MSTDDIIKIIGATVLALGAIGAGLKWAISGGVQMFAIGRQSHAGDD